MAKYDGPEQVKITAGGKSYIFRPSEITPRIARRVRQETGMALMTAISALSDSPDLDVLSVICYAAALQTDPDSASLDDIDESFNYTSEITVELPTDEGEGDPET